MGLRVCKTFMCYSIQPMVEQGKRSGTLPESFGFEMRLSVRLS